MGGFEQEPMIRISYGCVEQQSNDQSLQQINPNLWFTLINGWRQISSGFFYDLPKYWVCVFVCLWACRESVKRCQYLSQSKQVVCGDFKGLSQPLISLLPSLSHSLENMKYPVVHYKHDISDSLAEPPPTLPKPCECIFLFFFFFQPHGWHSRQRALEAVDHRGWHSTAWLLLYLHFTEENFLSGFLFSAECFSQSNTHTLTPIPTTAMWENRRVWSTTASWFIKGH